MKAVSLLTAGALSLAAAGVLAQEKPSGNAGATTEKSRMAGGVSQDLLKEFGALDSNKDGFLAKSELSSKPELAKNFAKADKNRDGKLDQSEYQVLKAETSSKGGE